MPGQSSNQRTTIAPEGWPIIGAFVVGAALLAAGGWWLHPLAGWSLLVVGLLLSVWCIWFFRDPSRVIPPDAGAVVSAADGVVSGIDTAVPPGELGLSAGGGGGPMKRVSVFMNVFNVHVNRAPLTGTVRRIEHHAGKFFNASLDKASEHNERCSLLMETPGGRTFVVVQIAGLIARRIVCRVKAGASLGKGERFGIIRFGSRVDCYLPPDAVVRVAVGDRTVAGETIIATLDAHPGGQPA